MSTTITKERPILFNGDMVRAVLDDRKTETRRLIKPAPPRGSDYRDGLFCLPGSAIGVMRHCPFGVPGDRLWVRETWSATGHMDLPLAKPFNGCQVWYRAENNRPTWAETRWKPSIHMPRWASRITLEVVRVWAERVQEISEVDAIAEGISVLPLQSADDPSAWYQSSPGVHQARSPKQSFKLLWDSIYGKKPGCAWADNPWVRCAEFKRVGCAQ